MPGLLAADTVFVFESGHGIPALAFLSAVVYDKIKGLYRSAGLIPQITHVRASPGEAASIIVASGKGVFIVPGASRYHWQLEGKVAAIPLHEPLARIDV